MSTVREMNSSIINPLGESHPYYPLGVDLPLYVANTMDAFTLVTCFGIGVVTIFATTYFLAIRSRPTISTGDLLCALWWAMCGFIHLFFEGKSTSIKLDTTEKLVVLESLLPYKPIQRDQLDRPKWLTLWQATSHTTTERSPVKATYSANCGKNTRFPTRGT